MKKHEFFPYRIAPLVILLVSHSHGYGITNFVQVGESIQQAVDNANDGDTVAIFGGLYTEDVLVYGKKVTLQRLVGAEVFITGNLTYQQVTTTPDDPLYISNLKVGNDGSKKLSLLDCTNVVVANMDLTACDGFTLDKSANIALAGSTVSNIRGSKSSLSMSRKTVGGLVDINNNFAGYTNSVVTILQSQVTNYVKLQAGYHRILYSRLWRSEHHSGDVVVLGNYYSNLGL